MKYFINVFMITCALLTGCTSYDDVFIDKTEISEYTRSNMEDFKLPYPLSSFVTTIELGINDLSRINSFLEDMQTRLGDGYNPLFKKLDSIPIKKFIG